MADYKVSGTDLASIADAIRTKGGTSAGLLFPDGFITSIGNISTGGETLVSKSITANGTYDPANDDADGYSSVTVAVPSKLVTGTFTGTTAASAMDITIPYTGSGYPIAALIYPSDGPYKTGTTWYTTVQKSVVGMWAMAKQEIGTTPNYSNSGTNDYGLVLAMYKSSDSDSTAINANRASNATVYRNVNATAAYGDCAKFKSATTMTVFIAGTSYGFMKDIEHTYHIIYSA